MSKIAIIGGGFSGIMTITHLMEKIDSSTEIYLIDNQTNISKGIAYSTYSETHLLNVNAQKMSAFSFDDDHFLNWVSQHPTYFHLDRDLIATSFLPRKMYGEYLLSIWITTLKKAKEKNISMHLLDSKVVDLQIVSEKRIQIKISNSEKIEVDSCVLATGNHIPRNPSIKNESFFFSSNYFQNPWGKKSVELLSSKKPILIIGNGLTMVDTVLGLIENNYESTIYTISPSGFSILPHRSNNVKYSKLINELPSTPTLLEVLSLVNKHRKLVRELGLSAEIVIDSLRPLTQQLWKHFSDAERQLFMSRLRHFWGVARHRISLPIHDKIQELRIAQSLQILKGNIIEIVEIDSGVIITYFCKKDKKVKELEVERVINCTGPETDLEKLENSFLKECCETGILSQDFLKLGIRTNTQTYQTINSKGEINTTLFTLGPNLKGELWESIAIPELKHQALEVANQLAKLNSPKSKLNNTFTTN